MFVHRTFIHLRDTDATGVLYFPVQFKLALEALEAFLRAQDFPLGKVFQTDYLLPVVHAEADYSSPLKVSDELAITLKRGPFGCSSITLFYDFFDVQRGISAGKAKIVHVVTDKKTGKSCPIPEQLLQYFSTLEQVRQEGAGCA